MVGAPDTREIRYPDSLRQRKTPEWQVTVTAIPVNILELIFKQMASKQLFKKRESVFS